MPVTIFQKTNAFLVKFGKKVTNNGKSFRFTHKITHKFNDA